MKTENMVIIFIVFAFILFVLISRKIKVLQEEKVSLEREYEVLSQEYARFRSDWIEHSRDTLTGIAPDSINFNN